jgi:hypothetical protein
MTIKDFLEARSDGQHKRMTLTFEKVRVSQD